MDMNSVGILFLGSGDAFGSGGRLQSSILVESPEGRFLIDCGPSALIGLKRFGFDASGIGTVLISHLHGDHYGGVPFLVKETQVTGERENPLVIAGPYALESHVENVMKLFFPSPENPRSGFWPDFRILPQSEKTQIGDLAVTAYPAKHSKMANPLSLRIECGGKTIAYSGDTEWNEFLPVVCKDADVFICETFEYDRSAGNHLDYLTLMEHRRELDCKRILLTHLGDSMLKRCGAIELECAYDGMSFTV